MNIAVTSQGETLDSPVDPRFGRAKGFVVTDEKGENVSYADNAQNLNAPSGAGIQAAQNIIDLDINVLITGNCGPKAFSVLAQGGVEVFTGASGSVKDALEAYNEGKLQKADNPNVQGHWM